MKNSGGGYPSSRDRSAEDLLADVASIDLPDHSRGQLTHEHFQFTVIG
jgi:hypothetical protein